MHVHHIVCSKLFYSFMLVVMSDVAVFLFSYIFMYVRIMHAIVYSHIRVYTRGVQI